MSTNSTNETNKTNLKNPSILNLEPFSFSLWPFFASVANYFLKLVCVCPCASVANESRIQLRRADSIAKLNLSI